MKFRAWGWLLLTICLWLPCQARQRIMKTGGTVLAVVALDPTSLEENARLLIEARDQAGVSENQVRVVRFLAASWTPAEFQRLKLTRQDLPLLAVARLDGGGKIASLVGWPDFVERKVSDGVKSSGRVVRRWADFAGVELTASKEPPADQPLILTGTYSPNSDAPLRAGAEILITVQAQPGGHTEIITTPANKVAIPEIGPGLYQGKYVVSIKDEGTVPLSMHFTSADQHEETKPLGSFRAEGFFPPRILGLNPAGPNLYNVIGQAPSLSTVHIKCHIDMGSFLFVGLPDYDNEWNVVTNPDGRFEFIMDLTLGGTSRTDTNLDALFTSFATDPDDPKRRTAETQYTGKVQMSVYR